MRKTPWIAAAVVTLIAVPVVALAAGGTAPDTYVPPCTANTDACRQQRIVALENHYKQHVHSSPTPTATATTASPSATATTASPTPTATTASPTPTATSTSSTFPDASNTGVPAGTSLTAYTGPCTITATDTVIDGKTIDCDITVQAAGLIIRNSVVNGSVLQPDGVNASFRIEDSKINGADPYACVNCGVGYRNFTILRSEIVGTNRGAYCEKTCLIQDSWIHGTNLEPVASNLAHASAVRVEQYATLIHNTLACDYVGPFPNDEIGCSADMSGYPDFAPITHNTIDGNLFKANPVGAGFCAYGGGTSGKPYSGDPANATYIVFKNNVFERGSNGKCGTYGPITDFITGRTGNTWTNNLWSDGASVPAA